jgi:hypothetical protein
MAEAQFQMNLTFLPVEDRLLLRIAFGSSGSMAEYRLLLTRRFVKHLWSGLERILAMHAENPCIAPEGRTAVIEFQQRAALSQTDFSTPYQGGEAVHPLGQQPLLVHGFKTWKAKDSEYVVSLEATTKQTVNVTCSYELICSLRKLLADMIVQAEWELPCSLVPAGAISLSDALGGIH